MGGAENTGSARRCSTTDTLVYSPQSPCRNGAGPIPSGYSRVRTLRLYLLLGVGDVSSSRGISKSEKAYFADTRPHHESSVSTVVKERNEPARHDTDECPLHLPLKIKPTYHRPMPLPLQIAPTPPPSLSSPRLPSNRKTQTFAPPKPKPTASLTVPQGPPPRPPAPPSLPHVC